MDIINKKENFKNCTHLVNHMKVIKFYGKLKENQKIKNILKN